MYSASREDFKEYSFFKILIFVFLVSKCNCTTLLKKCIDYFLGGSGIIILVDFL